MPLNRIRIEGLRCLNEVDFSPHPKRTYFFGPNGAGKTSLLEGIYLLGRGRSFRTRHSRRLIQHGQERFSVYGELSLKSRNHRLGVGLGPSGLELRLDSEPAVGMSSLAKIMPVHVIDPNIHSLIEGSPGDRRRFLDWGVFHVEHGYLDAWRRYRRTLGQRNAALKLGQGSAVWDASLLEAGTEVDIARRRYAEDLVTALEGLGEALLGSPLEVSYRAGWPEGLDFCKALEASNNRDLANGTTHVGPHRADLSVKLASRSVREEVSRGQQKLVAAGLILAQIKVFAANNENGGLLLVDDPAAELDGAALSALLSALDKLPAQQIITGLTESILPPAPGFPVFHVEQGHITKMVQ
jgi:DNA replication and repair protein RecF